MRFALLLLAGCGRIGFGEQASNTGGEDAGDAGLRCTTVLAADFSALPPWGELWDIPTPTQARAELAGGVLRLEPSGIVNEYAGFKSTAPISFRDHRLTLGIVERTAEAIMFLGVDQEGEPWIRIQQFDQVLLASLYGSFDVTSAYDPAIRWWRLAERGGTTSYETSVDGVAFTVVQTAPTPAFVDSVYVAIGAGNNSPIGVPGVGVVDNLSLEHCVP